LPDNHRTDDASDSSGGSPPLTDAQREWRPAMNRSAGMETRLRPPSPISILGEARIIGEWFALQLSTPIVRFTAPRGKGEPVLVVPGFGTDDSWTRSLRRFLGSLGYYARGWDLGRNHGRVPDLIPKVVERTAELARESGRQVRLIGWSLGGYLAREVARERPESVSDVITLGAPVVGGPKYTASAPMYLKKGYDLDKIEADVQERESIPIVVPIRAVYSRSDGVVAWRACVDRLNPDVTHHEVVSSHLGLVASPTVFGLVARLLAEPGSAADPPN
jgi:pimeloyl-ACP methyl ester carboxylesterase